MCIFEDSTQDILKRRYANGEIDRDTYQRMLREGAAPFERTRSLISGPPVRAEELSGAGLASSCANLERPIQGDAPTPSVLALRAPRGGLPQIARRSGLRGRRGHAALAT